MSLRSLVCVRAYLVISRHQRLHSIMWSILMGPRQVLECLHATTILISGHQSESTAQIKSHLFVLFLFSLQFDTVRQNYILGKTPNKRKKKYIYSSQVINSTGEPSNRMLQHCIFWHRQRNQDSKNDQDTAHLPIFPTSLFLPPPTTIWLGWELLQKFKPDNDWDQTGLSPAIKEELEL